MEAESYAEGDAAEKFANITFRDPDIITSSIIQFVQKCNSEIKTGNKFDLMLDAGCGNGRQTTVFAEYFKSIIGFDLSVEQIKIAKEKNTWDNIEYVIGREKAMPASDNSVDLLTCDFAIQYMDIKSFIEECKRVLKPTGCAVVYGFEHVNLFQAGNDVNKVTSNVNLLASYLEEANEWFQKNYHAEHELLARYRNVFNNISGMNKSRRDDLNADVFFSLAGIKSYFLSIPAHRLFVEWMKENKKRDPMEELGICIKKDWGVQDSVDHDVKVGMTVSFFAIYLTKSQ